MTPPDWGLTLAYWLHMLATVLWIGGLAALSLLILPAAHKSLDNPAYAALLDQLVRRMDPLGWFCLSMLVATGMFQMSANPNYQGVLVFSNTWAVALLAKHILFLGMVAASAYSTWVLLPGLRRSALRRAKSDSESNIQDSNRLQKQETRLLRLNLILGILILALTATARVA